VTLGHQLIDALAGQLDHELAAAEPAAARRRQYPVLAEELLDQVFVALLRRHASSMPPQATSVA
jgi:hypothetical protein